MAALGDSITRGFNSCGFFVDCTSRSFAAGDKASIDSHYVRLRAVRPDLVGENHNEAESGAKVADLAAQARRAVADDADYVTILIGANDACTANEASMTDVRTFRARFQRAIDVLTKGSPGVQLGVVSIPDLERLWEVGKGNAFARAAWDMLDVCPSMLRNPTSTKPADVARRARVQQRVEDYNAAMADICAATARCRTDGNAVFDHRFTLDDVSRWDFFHPDSSGQATLARVSFAALWPDLVGR
jgi:lysophospholipase L1-like esterase